MDGVGQISGKCFKRIAFANLHQIGQTAGSEVLARLHYLRWLEFASDEAPDAVVPESSREVKCRNSKRCPDSTMFCARMECASK